MNVEYWRSIVNHLMCSELVAVGVCHRFLYHLLLKYSISTWLLRLTVVGEGRCYLKLQLHWRGALAMWDVILDEIAQLRMSRDVHCLTVLHELGLELVATFISCLAVLCRGLVLLRHVLLGVGLL